MAISHALQREIICFTMILSKKGDFLMAEQVKTSWQYHPLSGQELLKWIFADAWQKLVGDGQFGNNLVYHNPTYVLRLEVTAYDGSKGPTNGALTECGGGMTTSEQPLARETKLNRIKLDVSSESLKEPDKARELLDEGRYKVTNVDGVLVDKKVKKGDK